VNEMVGEWITYRTRFLIKARQLDTPLTFVDCLGREHSGQKGDYLVLSSDGSQRIAPREIFEDIYVPMKDAGPWPAWSQIANEDSQVEQRVSRTLPSEQTAAEQSQEFGAAEVAPAGRARTPVSPSSSTHMPSQSVLSQPAAARSPQSRQMHSQRAVRGGSAAQVCLA
jgi:hypothetical protein